MISGIILASGFSKRMRQEKLLIEVGGIPLLKRVISSAFLSLLDEIILVYQNEELLKLITIELNIITVYNDAAFKGQSAAVKKGINACSQRTDAYLFMVGDQPFLDKETINTILNYHIKYPSNIIVPQYADRIGNPILFPSIFREELLNVENDKGGISVINANLDKIKYIKIMDAQIGTDIDTMEDLESLNLV